MKLPRKRFWIPLCIVAPLLMAPTGGFPSRPQFQSVGIGVVAPAGVGSLSMAGATPTQIINATSGNPQVVYRLSGTNKASLCIASANGQCITDATTGDLNIISVSGSNAIRFSLDGGTTTASFVPVTKLKPSDEGRSSTTTLADDSALAVTGLPSGNYAAHIVLLVDTASGTQGIKITITDQAGTVKPYMCTATQNTSNANAAPVSNDNSALEMDLASSAAHASNRIVCDADLGATGVKVRWAQNTSSATVTTMQSGSYMILTRLL